MFYMTWSTLSKKSHMLCRYPLESIVKWFYNKNDHGPEWIVILYVFSEDMCESLGKMQKNIYILFAKIVKRQKNRIIRFINE